MSALGAAARPASSAGRPATPVPSAAGRKPRKPALAVVPARRPQPVRGAFAGVVAAVLGLGLLALLGLNTLLGQNAFVIQDLRQQAAQLSDREEALRQEVAELEAPARLADQARALGMVPAPQPAFVDPATGAVLGIPAPGVAPPKPAPAPVPAPAAAAPVDPAAAPAPAPVSAPTP